MGIGRCEELRGARRFALLTHALLFRIDCRLRQLTLCREDRPAEITGQWRSELRHIFGQRRIVARQRGEAVGGRLGVGVIEFGRRLGARTLMQRPERQAENERRRDAGERDQHLAREPRYGCGRSGRSRNSSASFFSCSGGLIWPVSRRCARSGPLFGRRIQSAAPRRRRADRRPCDGRARDN